MADRPPSSVNEELLQWLWQTLRFRRDGIRTADDKTVTIFDPGTLNKSDGPDFMGCRIQIGELTFYGDVEIHWKMTHWNHHGHHHDERYNRVVLHVVWEDPAGSPKEILRKDGTVIPVLVLRPLVSRPLASFLKLSRNKKPGSLPCSGNMRFISEEAFRIQIERAHKEYFEQKADDLLTYSEPDLPPSEAWLKMVSIGFGDGLGIAYNREPMRRLCSDLFTKVADHASLHQFAKHMKEAAFRGPNTHTYNWKRKGSRPANHPERRVQQLAAMMWALRQKPFSNRFRKEPAASWRDLLEQNGNLLQSSSERLSILYGTVWLPSLYLLGQLFGSRDVQDRAYQVWQDHEAEVPDSLLKPFQSLGQPEELYRHKLGSIYQLRSYCRPRRCASCEVFKDAISS